MNKAFVKDIDDQRAINPLPDRQIPSEPNYVTAEGLVVGVRRECRVLVRDLSGQTLAVRV